MAWGSAVMVAVGAGAEAEGGSAEGGGRVLAFLWQPVAASRAMDALKRIVVSLWEREVCREIILSTVRGPRVSSQPSVLVEVLFEPYSLGPDAVSRVCRGTWHDSSQFLWSYHRQLQLGMSEPEPVSARFWVPSASMVMMRVWSARPSEELA